ncbi:MAG: outer membrane beta-barrel protein [Cyclobacteriaceae bacterium]
MENTERQKFDNAWRDAFQQAEQNPSAEVWSALDSELTRAEGGVMKRRVVFYQRLAAASILFALVFGSLTTYYNLKQDTSVVNEIANANKSTNETDNTIPDQTIKQDEVAENEDKDELAEDGSRLPKSGDNKTNGNSIFNKSDQSAFIAQSKKDSGGTDEIHATEQGTRQSRVNAKAIAGISTQDLPSPEVKISGKLRDVTIVRKLPAMPASFMAESRKEKKSGEDLWASVGASAGNYSPQANFNSYAMASPATGAVNLNNSASSNSYSQGSAYSVGLNLAKRVSNHWVVQGGLSYLNQSIGYTSNFATVYAGSKSAFVADYATLQQNASTLTLTNPYEINSVNQFVSLPIQAGYLLVDRKVGWQLSTGMATDIFLQNTLTDKSGQLDKYSAGAGDDSPYRTLSWSALMSTELSYKVGTQYRVSLAPGLRYTMSPVLKSAVGTGNPIVWDIGFRFRYIFK